MSTITVIATVFLTLYVGSIIEEKLWWRREIKKGTGWVIRSKERMEREKQERRNRRRQKRYERQG